ncbi:MAG: hypothetical protein MR000_05225, partial [Cloacibacillus porcorum]|uniref:hypothetical protein n=1 Tax=Cloacibacillus porcorum TaxID=1197717 RepID=UPI00235690E2
SSAAFAAGSVWRGSHAKQSNSPSVSAKNIAEPAPSQRAPLRAKSKDKALFIPCTVEDKSLFTVPHPKEIGV